MQIWPAIDIRDGKCVRLVQGDYSRQLTYGHSPLAMAHHWIEQGADRLHLVDLDAARTSADKQIMLHNRELIATIVRESGVPCQVGGGLRSLEHLEFYLEAGAAQLVCGTGLVQNRDWFGAMAGRFPGRLIAGLDARGGRVATAGWETDSGLELVALARELAGLPIGGIVFTDIERDGMLSGPSLEPLQQLAAAVSVPLIASGGVHCLADISELIRRRVAGCIVGRALYENQLDLRAVMELVRHSCPADPGPALAVPTEHCGELPG